MTQAADIIRRCTRAGHTQWQNVANQMGITRDKARALYEKWVRS